MELSYWEKNSLLEYDFIVIGAGITGLSTALSIYEKNEDARIAVLERGLLPTGASTKNAGFACFGSLSEIASDIERMGAGNSVELVHKRWRGLKKLRSRLSDEKMQYRNYGGYELLMDSQIEKLNEIDRVNELLNDIFQQPVFSICDDKIQKFGFDSSVIRSMVFNGLESQINTGSMMMAMYQLTMTRGISVITGAAVSTIDDRGDNVTVGVNTDKGDLSYLAKKVAVCSNAFAPELLPELDIKPGRGQVLVTKPVENLPFKGTFHVEEGFYYFRNLGDRVIFGGGRNTELDEETTAEFGSNEKVRNHLVELLNNVIFPGRKVEIDSFWSGIMAFGPTKDPIVKAHSKNVVVGVRLGGMGVAIGSLVGEIVADKMCTA